jgi:hypothetical protein
VQVVSGLSVQESAALDENREVRNRDQSVCVDVKNVMATSAYTGTPIEQVEQLSLKLNELARGAGSPELRDLLRETALAVLDYLELASVGLATPTDLLVVDNLEYDLTAFCNEAMGLDRPDS